MFTNPTKVLQYVVLWIYLVQHARAFIPSGYLGCYSDYRIRVLQGKRYFSKNNCGNVCKSMCKGYRYAGTEAGDECFCGNYIKVVTASRECSHKCPGNKDEVCGGYWRISIYDTWPCANLVPCKNDAECVDINADNFVCNCSGNWTGRHCDEGMTVTTSSALTTSQTTNKTNAENITALSSQTPLAFSDESGSVIPAVLVPVVVIIALAVTIFLLWRRHRHQRPLKVTEGKYGTKDMHYEDLRPDHAAESGYTEFSRNNLDAEETTGSVYQTIDSLPEDQTECNSGYEHLKIHTTKSIDVYYLDITAHEISRGASCDATYANTPYVSNGQDEETKHSNAQRTKKKCKTITVETKENQQSMN